MNNQGRLNFVDLIFEVKGPSHHNTTNVFLQTKNFHNLGEISGHHEYYIMINMVYPCTPLKIPG